MWVREALSGNRVRRSARFVRSASRLRRTSQASDGPNVRGVARPSGARAVMRSVLPQPRFRSSDLIRHPPLDGGQGNEPAWC